MPELSNIQTYEKLNGNDFKPSIEKFAKVLKRIGVWNTEIKKDFESLKWEVEDNGFVYFSNSDSGFYKTLFSEIKVRPLVMAWTPAIDKTFKDNWISCDLLIETETIRNFENGNYKELTFEFIKKLVKEMAMEFDKTGIYFTDEAQDGEDFDGIRTTDRNKIWNFDYALIPKKLKELYGEKPNNYKINETDNWIETWNSDNWNEKNKSTNAQHRI
ncbi:hypothetical protein MC378_14920 [Polaribacter sp. MSW13]|uniref:Uncharacterized protein n=1 Tax=Polaribacter marinus TaxID=2916838 RepID=A0A9X1VTB7_9FLAO|nr:hypothetical protein [Polaribacter marinus]MCI2230470.1 hypothetical protein [Polaribacter marinus]